MTDREAYELMLKYFGGEKGILMVRDMIHMVGVDKAVENMVETYSKNGIDINEEFRQWIKQSFTYMQKEMSTPKN